MFRFATDRPVAVFMITAAAAFFGLLSYRELGLELLPDLDHPTLTVRTAWAAAAPEEVEQEVTRRLEGAVGTVEALAGMHSASRAGESEVVLEFDWDTDMDRAAQRVRERLSRIELPGGAEPPLLLRHDPSLEPVMSLALSGDGTPAELRYWAEEVLAPEISKLEGVAAVRVLGGLEREIQVRLTPAAIAARGISVRQVAERLAAANVNVAGGTLREGTVEFLVRTVAELRDPEALRRVVVADAGGVLVRLGDVAEVQATVKDPRSLVRVDGRAAVRLDVDRQAGANIVEVCDRVRVAVFGTPEQQAYTADKAPGAPPPRAAPTSAGPGKGRDLAATRHRALTDFLAWRRPPGTRLDVVGDQSIFIRASLQEVRGAAVVGGLLAVLLLYLFLGSGYSTLVIAVAIPLSVALTFVPLLLFGVTLNIMSLGGLALGIGMLVDNSVVVLESIFRCREEGDGVKEAAVRGTREVGPAVVASTLTTVAVFLPVVFVEGVAGQVFGDLALAVVFSLLASLAVAVFVVPMLASRSFGIRASVDAPTSWHLTWRALPAWRARKGLIRKVVSLPWVLLQATLEAAGNLITLVVVALVLPLGLLFRGAARGVRALAWAPARATALGMDAARRAYGPLLRSALRAPLAVMVIVAGLGALAWMSASRLGAELIPDVHQGILTAELRFPVGTPLEETAARVDAFARQARALPGVRRVDTFVGQPDLGEDDARERGTHTAAVTLHLTATAEAEAAAIARLRTLRAEVPGADLEITRPALFTLRPPVRVEILGHHLPQLGEQARVVEALVAGVPGVRDVRTSVRPGHPELQLDYDRARLAALGLRPREVAERLRGQLEGEVATELKERSERVDVRVRLDPERVQSRGDLETLVVNPGAEVPLPLESVARIIAAEGPAEIRHVDGQRAALITGSTGGLDLGTTADAIRAVLAAHDPPPGIEVRLRGQDEEMKTSLDSLRFALILAIFLVYVVMASQFESLRAPLVIMGSLPLAAIGAFLLLGAVDEPLSVVVFVGLITLAGIVVNNAIVLVDYAERLRQRGMALEDALVEAGRTRLRPILMTTLTTVLGLLPLALGAGEGAELRRPMALTLIGGLVVATGLTLVVIPVLYRLVVGRTPSTS
ncbi:MAG: efflux RND transporter permease subunit [Myxococcales bacterium]|nr:efflux RND transporter permease subunit [Myxococcales bacterium]